MKRINLTVLEIVAAIELFLIGNWIEVGFRWHQRLDNFVMTYDQDLVSVRIGKLLNDLVFHECLVCEHVFSFFHSSEEIFVTFNFESFFQVVFLHNVQDQVHILGVILSLFEDLGQEVESKLVIL